MRWLDSWLGAAILCLPGGRSAWERSGQQAEEAPATEAPAGPVWEAESPPEDPGALVLLAAGQSDRAYRRDLLLSPRVVT